MPRYIQIKDENGSLIHETKISDTACLHGVIDYFIKAKFDPYFMEIFEIINGNTKVLALRGLYLAQIKYLLIEGHEVFWANKAYKVANGLITYTNSNTKETNSTGLTWQDGTMSEKPHTFYTILKGGN